ncbi:hypothetical protein BJ508DRAFT_309268 [Ascobolus immersus RN42]|uniref:Uncharacterized protein n=1 Tax=Ascobolus immersus RN42 TaxID=1160509 RepID=A0A3N4I1B2_ASCIM|nr:hypothetical protein BJ508DRAFT_309268 [Ascobolus immersus RN42]
MSFFPQRRHSDISSQESTGHKLPDFPPVPDDTPADARSNRGHSAPACFGHGLLLSHPPTSPPSTPPSSMATEAEGPSTSPLEATDVSTPAIITNDTPTDNDTLHQESNSVGVVVSEQEARPTPEAAPAGVRINNESSQRRVGRTSSITNGPVTAKHAADISKGAASIIITEEKTIENKTAGFPFLRVGSRLAQSYVAIALLIFTTNLFTLSYFLPYLRFVALGLLVLLIAHLVDEDRKEVARQVEEVERNVRFARIDKQMGVFMGEAKRMRSLERRMRVVEKTRVVTVRVSGLGVPVGEAVPTPEVVADGVQSEEVGETAVVEVDEVNEEVLEIETVVVPEVIEESVVVEQSDVVAEIPVTADASTEEVQGGGGEGVAGDVSVAVVPDTVDGHTQTEPEISDSSTQTEEDLIVQSDAAPLPTVLAENVISGCSNRQLAFELKCAQQSLAAKVSHLERKALQNLPTAPTRPSTSLQELRKQQDARFIAEYNEEAKHGATERDLERIRDCRQAAALGAANDDLALAELALLRARRAKKAADKRRKDLERQRVHLRIRRMEEFKKYGNRARQNPFFKGRGTNIKPVFDPIKEDQYLGVSELFGGPRDLQLSEHLDAHLLRNELLPFAENRRMRLRASAAWELRALLDSDPTLMFDEAFVDLLMADNDRRNRQAYINAQVQPVLDNLKVELEAVKGFVVPHRDSRDCVILDPGFEMGLVQDIVDAMQAVEDAKSRIRKLEKGKMADTESRLLVPVRRRRRRKPETKVVEKVVKAATKEVVKESAVEVVEKEAVEEERVAEEIIKDEFAKKEGVEKAVEEADDQVVKGGLEKVEISCEDEVHNQDKDTQPESVVPVPVAEDAVSRTPAASTVPDSSVTENQELDINAATVVVMESKKVKQEGVESEKKENKKVVIETRENKKIEEKVEEKEIEDKVDDKLDSREINGEKTESNESKGGDVDSEIKCVKDKEADTEGQPEQSQTIVLDIISSTSPLNTLEASSANTCQELIPYFSPIFFKNKAAVSKPEWTVSPTALKTFASLVNASSDCYFPPSLFLELSPKKAQRLIEYSVAAPIPSCARPPASSARLAPNKVPKQATSVAVSAPSSSAPSRLPKPAATSSPLASLADNKVSRPGLGSVRRGRSRVVNGVSRYPLVALVNCRIPRPVKKNVSGGDAEIVEIDVFRKVESAEQPVSECEDDVIDEDNRGENVSVKVESEAEPEKEAVQEDKGHIDDEAEDSKKKNGGFLDGDNIPGGNDKGDSDDEDDEDRRDGGSGGCAVVVKSVKEEVVKKRGELVQGVDGRQAQESKAEIVSPPVAEGAKDDALLSVGSTISALAIKEVKKDNKVPKPGSKVPQKKAKTPETKKDASKTGLGVTTRKLKKDKSKEVGAKHDARKVKKGKKKEVVTNLDAAEDEESWDGSDLPIPPDDDDTTETPTNNTPSSPEPQSSGPVPQEEQPVPAPSSHGSTLSSPRVFSTTPAPPPTRVSSFENRYYPPIPGFFRPTYNPIRPIPLSSSSGATSRPVDESRNEPTGPPVAPTEVAGPAPWTVDSSALPPPERVPNDAPLSQRDQTSSTSQSEENSNVAVPPIPSPTVAAEHEEAPPDDDDDVAMDGSDGSLFGDDGTDFANPAYLEDTPMDEADGQPPTNQAGAQDEVENLDTTMAGNEDVNPVPVAQVLPVPVAQAAPPSNPANPTLLLPMPPVTSSLGPIQAGGGQEDTEMGGGLQEGPQVTAAQPNEAVDTEMAGSTNGAAQPTNPSLSSLLFSHSGLNNHSNANPFSQHGLSSAPAAPPSPNVQSSDRMEGLEDGDWNDQDTELLLHEMDLDNNDGTPDRQNGTALLNSSVSAARVKTFGQPASFTFSAPSSPFTSRTASSSARPNRSVFSSSSSTNGPTHRRVLTPFLSRNTPSRPASNAAPAAHLPLPVSSAGTGSSGFVGNSSISPSSFFSMSMPWRTTSGASGDRNTVPTVGQASQSFSPTSPSTSMASPIFCLFNPLSTERPAASNGAAGTASEGNDAAAMATHAGSLLLPEASTNTPATAPASSIPPSAGESPAASQTPPVATTSAPTNTSTATRDLPAIGPATEVHTFLPPAAPEAETDPISASSAPSLQTPPPNRPILAPKSVAKRISRSKRSASTASLPLEKDDAEAAPVDDMEDVPPPPTTRPTVAAPNSQLERLAFSQMAAASALVLASSSSPGPAPAPTPASPSTSTATATSTTPAPPTPLLVPTPIPVPTPSTLLLPQTAPDPAPPARPHRMTGSMARRIREREQQAALAAQGENAAATPPSSQPSRPATSNEASSAIPTTSPPPPRPIEPVVVERQPGESEFSWQMRLLSSRAPPPRPQTPQRRLVGHQQGRVLDPLAAARIPTRFVPFAAQMQAAQNEVLPEVEEEQEN